MTTPPNCPWCSAPLPPGADPCDVDDGDPQPDDENVAEDGDGVDCPDCDGEGTKTYVGLVDVDEMECETCEGTGRDLSQEEGLSTDDTPTFPFKINLGDTD